MQLGMSWNDVWKCWTVMKHMHIKSGTRCYAKMGVELKILKKKILIFGLGSLVLGESGYLKFFGSIINALLGATRASNPP